MTSLKDLNIWQRILLAVIIVVAVFIVLLGISKLIGDDAAAQQRNPGDPPLLYEGLQLDPILLALDKRALDEAYHDQLLKLFGVWLSSGSIDEARNFRNGLRNARRGYALAREAISAREKQIIDLDKGQRP